MYKPVFIARFIQQGAQAFYKILFLLLFALIFTPLFQSAAAFADSPTLYVTGRNVNMRQEPSLNGPVIGSWLLGQPVILRNYEGDFAAVSLPGKKEVVYIARQYVGNQSEAEAKYGPATQYMVHIDTYYRIALNCFQMWNEDTDTFELNDILTGSSLLDFVNHARHESLPMFVGMINDSNLNEATKQDLKKLTDRLDPIYFALFEMCNHSEDGRWEPYFKDYQKALENFIPLYRTLGDKYR